MKFAKVFGLSLVHPYYSGGLCADLAIEPTARTARLLGNLRCVVKAGPGWVRVFNDPGVLSPGRGDAFVFRLRLEDPSFALFTDLSDYSGTPSPVYTTGAPAAAGGHQLALASRPERRDERFTWASGTGEGRFALGGRPLIGAASRLSVEGAGPSATIDYDTEGNAAIVQGAAAKPGDPIGIGYFAETPPSRDHFADAEVLVDAPPDEVARAGLGDFELIFRPRRARWMYYLVTALKDPVTDFRIVEDPPAPDAPLKFSDANRRDLDAQPDPSDAVAASLATIYPGSRRVRFVSDDPVPCRERARGGVQLFVGANRLAAALPNPSPGRFTTVASGVEAARQDSWYEVVRH